MTQSGEEHGANGADPGPGIGRARLAIGLIQGLALYLLYHAGENHGWPSDNPSLFAALALVLSYLPLLAIAGLGTVRPRTLALWIAPAAFILAFLATYERSNLLPPAVTTGHAWTSYDVWNLVPSFGLFVFSAAGLFIAQALIAAADSERHFVASYQRYFDVSWKQGIQLALAGVFVGTFWLILELGADLFELIHLSFLHTLIEHDWFVFPATALATAASLHLTDVRTGLVAGIRGVALVLMSWLLPLLALLAGAFLFSLLFTGLEPLWQTRSAARLLLVAAAGLIILINAAWQSGPERHIPPLALRAGGTAAALLLIPLTGLATYALMLRVGQYGWTAERVRLAATLFVACTYAIGYGWAALGGSILRHRWLAGLAPVNIAVSFVVLAVLLAVFSPLADPVRIGVASQMARLKSGRVAADKFDYSYLHFQGGKAGVAALKDLVAHASGPEAATIRERAQAALNADWASEVVTVTGVQAAQQVTVYPKDYKLPQGLFTQKWEPSGAPPCLTKAGVHCDVFPAELTGAPPDQLLFVWTEQNYRQTAVLELDANGQWTNLGPLTDQLCDDALAAMRAGQYAVVAPAPPKYREIEAANRRYRIPIPAFAQSCSK